MGPFSTHRFLTRLALAAAHIFSWLFIFQYFFVFTGSAGFSAAETALTYAIAHTVSVLLTPYAARRLRHGVRGMLVNALLALASAFCALVAGFSGLLGSIGVGVLLFAVFMGVYRALYWIPYEIAARKRSADSRADIALFAVPAAAGLYMSTASIAPLYVLCFASICALLAIIPVYRMKDTQEGFSWSYPETFHNLFDEKYRIVLSQAFFDGFEGTALLLLWPIVMLMIVNWSYAVIGLVISLTLYATVIARSLVEEWQETITRPSIRSIVTMSGWVLRGTVAAPFTIAIVDTYFHTGAAPVGRGVDMLIAEQSADSNTYVDEFTALKEMGQGIGRISFCLMFAALSSFVSFGVLSLTCFVIAGLMAVLSIQLNFRAKARPF